MTLTATVEATGKTVNEGTVNFQLKQGTINIGTVVTSGTVTNGIVSVGYPLPAGLAEGAYTINATYSGSTHFAASRDTTKILTVQSNVSLPLQIGVDDHGDQLTSLGSAKYQVSGRVTINSYLSVSAP